MERGFLPRDEVGRISALRRYNILDTPADGVFDRITRLAARLLDVPMAMVSLVDTDRVWFKSRVGLNASEIERHHGLCSAAIMLDEPWVVSDASKDPRTRSNPLVVGSFGLRFYAGVPLTTREGYNMGTLCVIDREPRQIGDSEIATLKDLAAMVMDQLELRLAGREEIERERAGRREVEEECGKLQARLGRRLRATRHKVDSVCVNGIARRSTAGQTALHSVHRFHDRERKRIAYQLHDEVAQMLATSRLDLSLVRMRCGEKRDCDNMFASLDWMLETSILSLKRIATDLHPNALDEGGLYFALASLLRNFSRVHGIACELVAQEEELCIDEVRSNAAYRIVQEALSNIGRHSKAHSAVVMLRCDGGDLSIRVQDDGLGIGCEDLNKPEASGLLAMGERVRAIGGTLNISGRDGHGTALYVVLPAP